MHTKTLLFKPYFKMKRAPYIGFHSRAVLQGKKLKIYAPLKAGNEISRLSSTRLLVPIPPPSLSLAPHARPKTWIYN
jgi:hypothetical protein